MNNIRKEANDFVDLAAIIYLIISVTIIIQTWASTNYTLTVISNVIGFLIGIYYFINRGKRVGHRAMLVLFVGGIFFFELAIGHICDGCSRSGMGSEFYFMRFANTSYPLLAPSFIFLSVLLKFGVLRGKK